MSRYIYALLSLVLILASGCSGGGGGSTLAAEQTAVANPASGGTPANCGENCFLSAIDVETIISQAVAEATVRNVAATIAVVDRVGNVLAVFQMSDADAFATITSTDKIGAPVVGGLENLNFIPSTLASIAKAVTGAYLSTSGNAFSTRTASQIIQRNFNPGEDNVPSGPLFGVQFSQLPCSDFSQRFSSSAVSTVGPHRSPLGLAADPGGLPLYIDGVSVGAVGVIADGIYGLDKNISGFDIDLDELIATAATQGYAAPLDIRADVITIVGKTARFSDSFVADLISTPADARSITELQNDQLGDYVEVVGYYDALAAKAGTIFGQAASGIRAADPAVFLDANGQSLDAFVFVDEDNNNRYVATGATDSPAGDNDNSLTADEVQMILNEAIGVANQSRAQIRVPAGTQARVTISVVDSNGVILGMGRTRDGPVFGADVSLQKARTATFFSGTGRASGSTPADILRALPDPLYLEPQDGVIDANALATLASPAPSFARYVLDTKLFFDNPDALEASGSPVAFSDRAGGNISRPNFPDGPTSGQPGPLSKPPGEWSIFSVGLQLDLAYNSIVRHLAFVFGLVPTDVAQNCLGNTGLADVDPFTVQGDVPNLANGIQIFPGSVPIYRDDILVGGIGVSGDGVDQDDMISFLGLHRAGLRLNTGIHNAPVAIRADLLNIPGESSRLRYVNCPQVPFINSNDTEVCDGI
ncbi:MAG: heme-binding protein [Pseudomonadales bacterium]|nr:heme-binding protein [Pseudomonadales bacterium]